MWVCLVIDRLRHIDLACALYMKICQRHYNLNYCALKFLYILSFVSSFIVVFFTAVLFKDQFTSLTTSPFFSQ